MEPYRRSACDRCRGQKLRCVRVARHGPYINGTGLLEPCERCVRAGAECVSSLPPPRKLSRTERYSSILPSSIVASENVPLHPLFPKVRDGFSSQQPNVSNTGPGFVPSSLSTGQSAATIGDRTLKRRSDERSTESVESYHLVQSDLAETSVPTTTAGQNSNATMPAARKLSINNQFDFEMQLNRDNSLEMTNLPSTMDALPPLKPSTGPHATGQPPSDESTFLLPDDMGAFMHASDPKDDCLHRLADLNIQLYKDFGRTGSVTLSELLNLSASSFDDAGTSGCGNDIACKNRRRNIIGRVLDRSQSFLDIILCLNGSMAPSSAASTTSDCSYSAQYWEDHDFGVIDHQFPFSPPPTGIEATDVTEKSSLPHQASSEKVDMHPFEPSNHVKQHARTSSAKVHGTIDMPSTLTVLTCYTWILQAYNTIFHQIYLALLADRSSPSSSSSPPMPPAVLPGLQIGGFSLEDYRDLQVEVLIHLSTHMLDKIDDALGIDGLSCPGDSEMDSRYRSNYKCSGRSSQGLLRASSARDLLDVLFKQNSGTLRAGDNPVNDGGDLSPAVMLRRTMKDIRTLIREL